MVHISLLRVKGPHRPGGGCGGLSPPHRELEEIARDRARATNIVITPSVAQLVAKLAKGSPRGVEALIERLVMARESPVTEKVAAKVLSALGFRVPLSGVILDVPYDLNELSGVDFERLVTSLLERMGLRPEMTKASGDGGVDIVAVLDGPVTGGRYVVQCKRFASDTLVGSATVREFYGALVADRSAMKGILITTSGFSDQARDFATGLPIELIDGTQLRELLAIFKAPSHEVLEAIQSYPDEPLPPPKDDPPAWLEVLMKKARACRFGEGDQVEDHPEAFRLYTQAAQLGSSAAYRYLGQMYMYGYGGSGSSEQALAHFEKAAAMGDYVAYAFMAELFKREGHEESQRKCWRSFVDALAAHVEKGGSFDDSGEDLMRIIYYLEDTIETHGEIHGAALFRKLSTVLLETAHMFRDVIILQHFVRGQKARASRVDPVIEWLSRGDPSP